MVQTILRMSMAIGLSLVLYGGAAVAQGEGADPLRGLPTIRIGVLQFGTVNWELEVIKDLGLAQDQGVRVEVVPLAQKNATAVAIQGGAVDMIVTDWLWVSRQRAEGQNYTFVPHSRAAGGVMVRPDAGIGALEDLRGKRLGVAGGPVDKSWLLLRAYAKQALGRDLAELVEPVFGAPPLLNELMLEGDLPAVLNFWHYGARLKAAGMQELIDIRDVLLALGVAEDLPLLGWVFDEAWGNENRQAVEAFLEASRKAKQIMLESDAIWDLLEDQIQAPDRATLIALRDTYREGIVDAFGELERNAAVKVYGILAEIGGPALVGAGTELTPGTFWTDAQGRPYQIVPYGMPPELVNPELLYRDEEPAVTEEALQGEAGEAAQAPDAAADNP